MLGKDRCEKLIDKVTADLKLDEAMTEDEVERKLNEGFEQFKKTILLTESATLF